MWSPNEFWTIVCKLPCERLRGIVQCSLIDSTLLQSTMQYFLWAESSGNQHTPPNCMTCGFHFYDWHKRGLLRALIEENVAKPLRFMSGEAFPVSRAHFPYFSKGSLLKLQGGESWGTPKPSPKWAFAFVFSAAHNFMKYTSHFPCPYDWTTGLPDNGNEWKKFRAVPCLRPLRSLVLCFV